MKDVKREIIEKGVQALLESHKVPYRVHAAVIQRLGEVVRDHKADLVVAKAERAIHKEMLASHDEIMYNHERQLNEWDSFVKHVLALEPKKGDRGVSGKDGRDGRDGVDAQEVDVNAIARLVLSLLPSMPEMPTPFELDEEALFSSLIARLKKEKSMTISDLKDGQGFLFNNKRYKFEELMRGAGGSGSGGANVATEELTPTAVVDDITLDLTQLANTFIDVLFVTRNGQVLMPNGSSGFPGSSWSISGNIVTVYNATDSDIYLVQYTFA